MGNPREQLGMMVVEKGFDFVNLALVRTMEFVESWTLNKEGWKLRKRN